MSERGLEKPAEGRQRPLLDWASASQSAASPSSLPLHPPPHAQQGILKGRKWPVSVGSVAPRTPSKGKAPRAPPPPQCPPGPDLQPPLNSGPLENKPLISVWLQPFCWEEGGGEQRPLWEGREGLGQRWWLSGEQEERGHTAGSPGTSQPWRNHRAPSVREHFKVGRNSLLILAATWGTGTLQGVEGNLRMPPR